MKTEGGLLGLACALVMTGCANQSGARMGLLSATAPVVAVMAGDLFAGEAEGYMNRTGKIEVHSINSPATRCMGHFAYQSQANGTGEMHCNDGATASFDFTALSMLSGYGIGTSTRGPFSFAYGLTPEEAKQYLTLPPTKRLEIGKDGSMHLIPL